MRTFEKRRIQQRKLAIFNDLSDMQPAQELEMPLGYQKSGATRIFYQFRTFTI